MDSKIEIETNLEVGIEIHNNSGTEWRNRNRTRNLGTYRIRNRLLPQLAAGADDADQWGAQRSVGYISVLLSHLLDEKRDEPRHEEALRANQSLFLFIYFILFFSFFVQGICFTQRGG